jgi:hypothetical protein
VVHTLSGFADYIEANKDELTLSEFVVHVVGPDRVDLVSKTTGEHHQRFRYITAQNYNRFAAVPAFDFGRWMDPEDLIIALQALFQGSNDLAKVLRLLGNIRDEDVKTRADDGVSQSVNARSGIAVVEKVDVPNPVTLAPYRTFPDVGAQPEGSFVFRLRKTPGGVAAALFEADGGAWRNDAVLLIANWLGGRFEDSEIDLAILA